MIVYPNAKINLGLNIIGRRADGYHDICTVMYPIPLTDELEIEKADGFSFSIDGIPLADDGRENLVVRAWRMVHEAYNIGNVSIRLTKRIPSGAGLGGGSADAAFTVKALSELFGLRISAEEMQRMVARLGADCAFFIKNVPALCEGIGDRMTEIALDLGGYVLVLVKPDVFVSTADAYAGCTPQPWERGLEKLIRHPIEEWKNAIKNDFERQVFAKFPELEGLKNGFYDAGALYSAMSGSGSSVFGIFAKSHDINTLRTANTFKMEL